MNNLIFVKAKAYRNVKDYKFVTKLEPEKKEEIVGKLQKVFDKFELINLQNVDEKIIKNLRLNNLYDVKVNNLLLKDDVCINLFNKEHLEIVCSGKNTFEVFEEIKTILEILQNKISLTYNDEYGYLMSDITKIGNGLTFEAQICLNCIEELGKIEQVKQNLKKLGYNLIATNNKSIFSISTMCNLGKTEKEIADDFDKILQQLQDLEIESAKMLDVQNHDIMLDKAKRSYAILENAYLLSYDELAKILIILRTSKNLDYIDIDNETIFKLQKILNNKSTDFISQTELKELAKKIQNVLKGDK